MVFVVGPKGTTGPSQAISSHTGHCNDFLPYSPQGPSDLPVRLATTSGVILVDFLVSGSRTFEGLCQLWAQGRAALCLCQGLCALARGSCSFLFLPSWGLGPWPFMHNHLCISPPQATSCFPHTPSPCLPQDLGTSSILSLNPTAITSCQVPES